MITPLILIQADSRGLRDLSSYARHTPSDSSRVSVINNRHYYDLSGDTAVKWGSDLRLPVSSKLMTIEGFVYAPPSAQSGSQFFIGGLAKSSFEHGFYLGFTGGKFAFSTGNGVRDYPQYSPVTDSEPFHFAWVMDGVNKLLYINGVLLQSTVIANGFTMPSSITLGFISQNNDPSSSAFFSKAHIHQLVVWDGVKYDGEFTPEHVKYEQQDLKSANSLLGNGSLSPVGYDGAISDKVLIKGAPTKRKVAIYRRSTNELVDVTWSDILGNYRFDNLRPNTEYYVLALDHERNYNAVIQDMIRTKL